MNALLATCPYRWQSGPGPTKSLKAQRARPDSAGPGTFLIGPGQPMDRPVLRLGLVLKPTGWPNYLFVFRFPSFGPSTLENLAQPNSFLHLAHHINQFWSINSTSFGSNPTFFIFCTFDLRGLARPPGLPGPLGLLAVPGPAGGILGPARPLYNRDMPV